MFDFGDPLDTAKLAWDLAFKVTGPAIPPGPYEELEEKDLRNLLAYLYIAVVDTDRDGASEEVMKILVEEYDRVFRLVSEVSKDFREGVRAGSHFPPTGSSPENIEKYKKLAEV